MFLPVIIPSFLPSCSPKLASAKLHGRVDALRELHSEPQRERALARGEIGRTCWECTYILRPQDGTLIINVLHRCAQDDGMYGEGTLF